MATKEKNPVELTKLPPGDRAIEQLSNLHQINLLRQSLRFWWRHSAWSYFNRGLFWGGLVGSISILSAIAGVALTKIDLVDRQIAQTLQKNSLTVEPQLDTRNRSKSMPKPLSSEQSTMLAKKHPAQDNSVAVQNTTNNPELGRQVVAYLRQRNFRHVYLVKDIPLKLKQTNIVSNYGQVETANYLKNILGFGNLEAKSAQQQPELVLQLGEDALFPTNYRFYR